MIVTNTQLAAALVVLGYGISPATNYTAKDVTFDFPDDPEIEKHSQAWRMLFSGMKADNTPLSKMFKVAKARQWILDQVIHGRHNQGLELPAGAIETHDFDFVVCLVAGGHYLLKLDKEQRLFYFSQEIERERELYDNAQPDSDYYYGRMYLRTLNDIVRRITGRNITRQQNQPAITSERR